MEPHSKQAAELLRQVSAAGGIDTPVLEIVSAPEKFGRAEVKSGGAVIYIRRELLGAPVHVLHGILAHEAAHIIRRDPQARRVIRWASIAAIWVIAGSNLAIDGTLALSGRWFLWAFALVLGLAAFALPRTVQLLIWRRQEYACDALAARLLGGPGAIVEYLEWMSTHTRARPRPLPLRLWHATHPSNAARRAALLKLGSVAPGRT